MKLHLVIPNTKEDWGLTVTNPCALCIPGSAPKLLTLAELDPNLEAGVVVLCIRLLEQDKATTAPTTVRSLVQGRHWCVWIHSGHNSRPTMEHWHNFFEGDKWRPYKFLVEIPTRLEWYSVGARASSRVYGHIEKVQNSVKGALSPSRVLSKAELLEPLSNAMRASSEEQGVSDAMSLLDQLMPHYMTDSMGRTVTPTQFDRLREWCATHGEKTRHARGFREQIGLLSQFVTDALGCEANRKAPEAAG